MICSAAMSTRDVYHTAICRCADQGRQTQALAVTGERRSRAARCADGNRAGAPGLVVTTWNGVLAPAGTPTAILDLLHREVTAAANLADVKGTMRQRARKQ
jgi:tripartite-type tricarboxylate transporter receptor subunit TctC